MEKTLSRTDQLELLMSTNIVIKSAQQMQYHILTGEWNTVYADGAMVEKETGYIRNFCTKFFDAKEYLKQ